MKKTIFSFLFFSGFHFSLTAQSWQQVADFPGIPLDDAVSFSIGDHGYVVTGFQTGFTPTNTGYRYHAYTDTWEQIPSLPALSRQYSCAGAIGGKGYIFGGINGPTHLKDVWEYDPATPGWTLMDSLPFPGLSSAVCITINNKAYVGTGTTEGDFFTKEWWEFDPLTNAWTQKMDFPGHSRKVATGFSVNGKGYVLTGIDSGFVMYKDVWEYEPLTNTWTQKSDFPGSPRFYAKSIAPGNSVNEAYLLFGWDSTGTYTHDVWKYDASVDSWTALDTFPSFGRKGVSTFTINNEIFFSTGIRETGERLAETWAFGHTIGIETLPADFLKIYPNPSAGEVYIDPGPQASPAFVTVTDISGRNIYQVNASQFPYLLSLSDPGIYFIHLTINGATVLKKLTVY